MQSTERPARIAANAHHGADLSTPAPIHRPGATIGVFGCRLRSLRASSPVAENLWSLWASASPSIVVSPGCRMSLRTSARIAGRACLPAG